MLILPSKYVLIWPAANLCWYYQPNVLILPSKSVGRTSSKHVLIVATKCPPICWYDQQHKCVDNTNLMQWYFQTNLVIWPAAEMCWYCQPSNHCHCQPCSQQRPPVTLNFSLYGFGVLISFSHNSRIWPANMCWYYQANLLIWPAANLCWYYQPNMLILPCKSVGRTISKPLLIVATKCPQIGWYDQQKCVDITNQTCWYFQTRVLISV